MVSKGLEIGDVSLFCIKETVLVWKKVWVKEEGKSKQVEKYVESEYSFAELIDWKGKQK